MIVLGLNANTHDKSCCLVRDGEIITAVEEERLTREKHSLGPRSKGFQCIDYCLECCGLTINDVDYIFTNDISQNLKLDSFINAKIHYVNHHLAHAASAYYTCGKYDSAILVIDGQGDQVTTCQVETVSFLYGFHNNINVIDKKLGKFSLLTSKQEKKLVNFNSLGYTYQKITELIGFGEMGQGKTMGLAPYGSDIYCSAFYEFIHYNGKEFIIQLDLLMDFVLDELSKTLDEGNFHTKANISYALQSVLEKYYVNLVNELYSLTPSKNLCIAGGIALNSSCNGKLFEKTPFENIHIINATGDAGIAIGCALYGYYSLSGDSYSGQRKMVVSYLGKSYTDDDVEKSAQKYRNQIVISKLDHSEMVTDAAQSLADGKIIGWFQGGSEFGPRALGHRSILANPGIKDMKNILNSHVKFREPFRPFAPSVLKHRVKDYFDYVQEDSNFMLFICRVREDKADTIPSVTHVDKTARLQTVSFERQGTFYELIECFSYLTDIPMVLNTSFNIKGEPIVETPDDAIQSFLRCDLDKLYIHDYRITKKKG